MTTTRSATATTTYYRVRAAPPPFTSQPSGAIWSPSRWSFEAVDVVERLDGEAQLAGGLLDPGDGETQCRCSDRRARTGSKEGHVRAGTQADGHAVLDQLCRRFGGQPLLGVDADLAGA